MGHLTYLGVLVGCLLCAVWLEPVLRVGVARQWRRLLATVVPVAVVFSAWDLCAVAAGQWSYDPGQLIGLTLPGGLPVEELLFFLVVPVCAVLGFEAVRRATGRRAAVAGGAEQRGRSATAPGPTQDPG